MVSERETYQPSGRVSWGKLVLWFTFTLPVILLSGYFLCLAFEYGIYLLFVVPVFASLPTAGAVWFTMWASRCRNRWVGLTTGVVAGCIAFLSYYHFDFAYNAGFQHIHRIDLLPSYIQLRVATDVQGKVSRSTFKPDPVADAPEEARGARLALRWGLFLFDGLCVVLLPAGAGWVRAGRPFSEKYHRWLYDHSIFVERKTAYEIRDALEEGDPDWLADAAEATSMNPIGNQGQLRLHYIPYEPATPVYLSLWINQGAFTWRTWPEHLAKMVRLTPEEAAALIERLRPPGAKVAEIVEVEAAADRPAGASATATIEDVAANESANLMTGRTYTLLMVVNALPLILGLLVVIALVVLLILTWSPWGVLGRGAIAAAILGVIVVTLVLTAMYADFLPMALQHRWCAAAIRRRPKALVDPDDPETVFIGIIPRKNWGKLMVENAEDVGFLKVDAEQRALLFEGDKQRWSIPAESIESCEMEEFCIGLPDQREANVFVLAVVRANVGGRVWEAPLCPARLTVRRPSGQERRAWCLLLFDRIQTELLPRPSDHGIQKSPHRPD